MKILFDRRPVWLMVLWFSVFVLICLSDITQFLSLPVILCVLAGWVAIALPLIYRFFYLPVKLLVRDVRAARYSQKRFSLLTGPYGWVEFLAVEFNKLYASLNQLNNDLEAFHGRRETEIYGRTKHLNHKLLKARKAGLTDPLSGIYNRSGYEQLCQPLFDTARQNDSDLSCLMIDVDWFKQVNDTWGHPVGDKVIRFAGKLLDACTRQGDICARYGGDEFIVLLNGCSIDTAGKIAERIRKIFVREAIRLIPPDNLCPNPSALTNRNSEISDCENPSGLCFLGMSIGIASLGHNHPEDMTQLMDFADQALYQAKQKGRNRICQI